MTEYGNCRLPAEWEQHEATWLGWPHNKSDWPGKFTPVPWVYAEIVKKLAEGEKVRILSESTDQQIKIKKILNDSYVNLSNVEFFKFPSDRGWTRDSGPAFVKNPDTGETILTNFDFNAWAKYSNYKKDRKLPGFIAKKLKLKMLTAESRGRKVVLEGGSIDSNGAGTLITTEECLLDNNTQVRNPGFSKSDYEEIFRKYLGINKVIWLGKGIAGDDTHGHVDDLCRFVNRNTVVLVQENDPGDINYKPLNENRERLQDAKLADGSKLNVISLPMPDPLFFRGQRLPASYANFYIANSALLVPTFNDTKDRISLGIISDLIPDRPTAGIHSTDLVWGLGTLHCLTHEQPV